MWRYFNGVCRVRRIWLGLIVAVSGQGVLAQDVDCTKAEAQVEMTYCAEQAWNAADADLNQAYKAAIQMLKDVDAALPMADRGAVDSLRQAQRYWITFRDNACAAEGYPMHGGTAEPMVIYGCRARLTRERTEGLSYITDLGDGN